MKEILSIINLKEQENSFLKMVNIMKANTKMVSKNGKGIFYYTNGTKKYDGFYGMINMKEQEK